MLPRREILRFTHNHKKYRFLTWRDFYYARDDLRLWPVGKMSGILKATLYAVIERGRTFYCFCTGKKPKVGYYLTTSIESDKKSIQEIMVILKNTAFAGKKGEIRLMYVVIAGVTVDYVIRKI